MTPEKLDNIAFRLQTDLLAKKENALRQLLPDIPLDQIAQRCCWMATEDEPGAKLVFDGKPIAWFGEAMPTTRMEGDKVIITVEIRWKKL